MECKWCKNKLFDPIISFKDFPMYSSSVLKGTLLDENGLCYKYNFEITYCECCGLIQQSVIPDMNIVYAFSKNEGVGKKWENHYNAYASFILKNKRSNNKYLEIGGGNLKVANLLSNNGIKDISIVEIDKEASTEKYKFYNNFFENIDFNKKYNCIYSSHVFEHISDFDKHIKKILDVLEDNGYYYISLPNFQYWIENFFLNAFIQDHIVYPTENNIIGYLSNNFELISKDSFEDHSLFYCFKKISNEYNRKDVTISLENSKNTLHKYKNKLDSLDNFLDTKLKDVDQVYIFGSHIFAEILLSLPALHNKNVVGILDNSIIKQDKYLYYYNIYVSSPDIIKYVDTNNTKVIVFTGAYEIEIKDQINLLNPNVEIISSTEYNKYLETYESS